MVNANSSQIMNGVGEHFDPKKKKKELHTISCMSFKTHGNIATIVLLSWS